MTRTLRVRRSRGALSGVLLVALGIWGALIPFVGPYFHYAYTPNRTWDYTAGRLWLEVLPGVALVAGGVLALISRLRLVAVFGAWLAAAGGAWFAVGSLVAAKWTTLPSAGSPVGTGARSVLEQIGFFTGLGVVVVFVAGLAIGRLTVVTARDLATASTAAADVTTEQPAALLPKRRSLRLPSPVVRGRQTAKDEAVAERARAESNSS